MNYGATTSPLRCHLSLAQYDGSYWPRPLSGVTLVAVMKATLIPVFACLLIAASTVRGAPAAAAPAAPGAAMPTTPAASGSSANPTTGSAQNSSETDGNHRFWVANLPGGQYMVALDHLTAISRHLYAIPEAGLIVDEVTVDTNGQGLARFYFSSPITDGVNNNAVANVTARAKELVDYAGQRAGTDLHKMVIKKYPETTHARSIEYRVLSSDELTALYSSVSAAWQTGRGRVFTIK